MPLQYPLYFAIVKNVVKTFILNALTTDLILFSAYSLTIILASFDHLLIYGCRVDTPW